MFAMYKIKDLCVELKMSRSVLIILLSVFVGICLTLSPGTFSVLALILVISFALNRYVQREDRVFIFKVIILGFLSRILFLIFYHNFYLLPGHIDVLGPDGDAYSQRGWYISRLLLDHDPYTLPPVKGPILDSYYSVVEYYRQGMPTVGLYQVGLFTYFIGILFSMFNYSPLIVKFLNSGLSVLTGVVVYFLGKEVFNARIAKVAMVVFIFMPSIFIFSVTALKDPLITLILSLIVLLLVQLRKKVRHLLFLFLLGLIVLIESLRSRMAYPLVFFVFVSLLSGARLKLYRKILIVCAFFISFISVPKLAHLNNRILNPENFFSAHIGFINTPGNNYKIFLEKYYINGRLAELDPKGIFVGFLSGIFHFLFEPLPGRGDGIFSVALFLCMCIGYCLFPFVLMGLVSGIKYNIRMIMPVVIFLVIFFPLVAISEGNVGTAFRHRDMFMPFFTILGVAGYYKIRFGERIFK